MNAPLVEVSGLCKLFRPAGVRRFWGAPVPALEGVDLCLREEEFVALVGESGSGKTTLGRCLLGLLPFERGTVRVAGFPVGRLERGRRKDFRKAAQMLFQNPYASLNPVLRVRAMIAEAVRVHRDLGRGEVAAEVERLAHSVHLPAERLEEFPASLSGGERRRVAFARALATRPKFLVADEPISGLDPPIQAQLLHLMQRIYRRGGITFLLISHDLRVARALATRVLVLYRGRVVEDAPSGVFFAGGARHPYSQELLHSALESGGRAPGAAPVAARAATGPGCAYAHRCRRADLEGGSPCATMTPPLEPVTEGHGVACHRWRQA